MQEAAARQIQKGEFYVHKYTVSQETCFVKITDVMIALDGKTKVICMETIGSFSMKMALWEEQALKSLFFMTDVCLTEKEQSRLVQAGYDGEFKVNQ
jgi:hypothetical protein